MGFPVFPAVSGGGGSGGYSAAPVSGDGSIGTPFTIAAGAIALTKLATQANLTVLGNGSGGAAFPVALTVSAATGLVADATTLKVSLVTGVAGGQTIIGGTATTESILIRPNNANATTGNVNFIGAPGATTAFISNAGSVGSIPQLVMGSAAAINTTSFLNITHGFNGDYTLFSGAATANGNTTSLGFTLNVGGTPWTHRVYSPTYGTSGNITGYSSLSTLTGSGGVGNMIHRLTNGNSFVWESGTTERMRLTLAGNLTIGTGLATTATDGFLYVPSCAGVPTGVPTSLSSGNVIPLCVDRTNNKAYIYSGGAWVALN